MAVKMVEFAMCARMRRRISVSCGIFWVCLVLCGGCVQEEPMPVIVDSPSGPRLVRRPVLPEPSVAERSYEGVPREWLPPANVEREWRAIIIHHSATDTGNAALFDKEARQERNWDGVGYDFVIGNGTDSGDGEVEVTFRWRRQQTGAHCKTPNNWANERAVGICLVGNFEYSVPTRRQMQSLVKLVSFLQKRYGIPKSRIYGHKYTPGAGVTECPGRNFQMARLKAMLD